jgi:hypothetical protein
LLEVGRSLKNHPLKWVGFPVALVLPNYVRDAVCV